MSNSVIKLNGLITQYNTTLSNLNNDFQLQASNLYAEIANSVNPIYINLQSNTDHLEKVTNLLYVRNYYLTNNKQLEADMITTNINYEWESLEKSRYDI